MVRPER